MNVKKVVYAYGEHSGAAAAETVIPIYVDGSTSTVNYYTVPAGYKLKIYELDGSAETDTYLYIEVSFDNGSNWIKAKVVKLPANVHQPRSWRFPLIIMATKKALVRCTFYQSSAGAVKVSWHGEVEEME